MVYLTSNDGTAFSVDHLTRGELRGLHDDRLVFRLLRDVYVPADLVVDAVVRAAAVTSALPIRLLDADVVACDHTALWIYCGGEGPNELDVVQPARVRVSRAPGVRVHERTLRPGEVHLLSGLPVTGPTRTAADLARLLPAAVALPALDRLAPATGVDAAAVLVQLDRMGQARGVRRARSVVSQWSAQSVRLPVTR